MNATRPLTRQLDLNLLELFQMVYRLRNLTAAGRHLGLSQPAVSHALARLREAYGDPLFVRHARGVAPTPFADHIAPSVHEAIRIVRDTLARPRFDALHDRRHFRIAMSDIGERFFMPRLWNVLAARSPASSCECLSPDTAELGAALASGDIDLAIGFLPPLGAQVLGERLFTEHFVHLVRDGHPVLGSRRARARLMSVPHVLAVPSGTAHNHALERALVRHADTTPVVLRVRSFLAVGPIVAETDLVSPVPANLARLVAGHLPLRTLVAPVELPTFDVRMAWHRRYDDDPALRWLRAVLAETFGAGA